MTSFDYAASPDPIRNDLADAHRRQWQRIANTGTWLTGAQRVAVAEETRWARDCALCRERKRALSPFAVDGEHDHAGVLPAPMVDEIHRVTTDAARLSQKWFESLLEQGLSADAYVEALGVAVCTISIDGFHHAMGLPVEPLPEPNDGEPTRERPDDLVEGEAWVPMRAPKGLSAELGLPAGQAPYVIRALSLVPAEVHAWDDLSAAQYLNKQQMMRFEKVRAIDRSQIELVAGRVSALNECFY
jgi:hypothetical protein